MSFGALGLCDELLKAVSEQGYTTPSPIQIDAIPVVLSQRDVMAVAHTGTGKTAGFTLPMVQLLSGGSSPQAHSIRALVITPTRELAAQVAKSIQHYSRHLTIPVIIGDAVFIVCIMAVLARHIIDVIVILLLINITRLVPSVCALEICNFNDYGYISTAAVFGGVRIEPQISRLQDGLDVLVATPGRLIDLYNQQAINVDQLEILVLDEADRMLDLGFIDDIRRIQRLLPIKRQTLMFSATFSKEIQSLAKGMLNNPVVIEVAAANRIVDTIKQKIHPVDKERKTEVLIHLIKKNNWHQVLVFSRTKQGADSLVLQLKNAGISAESIHANRTQHARTHALEDFRSGNTAVLVATDIASRGIDINQLPCVVNFDLPYVPEDYVHRIGRTGRVGNLGLAISLFSEDEAKQLQSIERVIGRQFEREVIPGFAPSEKVPASSPYDDEEYGGFEPDPKPRHRGQSQGRGSRRGNASNRNRNN